MTEPVRVERHGTPDAPLAVPFTRVPPVSENANQANQRTTDEPRWSSIVDKVVTRRLVVVDDDDRERLIAEPDPNGEFILRIVSRGSEAGFAVHVGDEDDGAQNVLVSIRSRGGSVTAFACDIGAAIDVEKRGADEPATKLSHDGLEVHHFFTQAAISGEDGQR